MYLKGLSSPAARGALISVAHPDFHEQLIPGRGKKCTSGSVPTTLRQERPGGLSADGPLSIQSGIMKMFDLALCKRPYRGTIGTNKGKTEGCHNMKSKKKPERSSLAALLHGA